MLPSVTPLFAHGVGLHRFGRGHHNHVGDVIEGISDLQPPVASGALADDVLPEVDVRVLFLELAAQPGGIVAAVGTRVRDEDSGLHAL